MACHVITAIRAHKIRPEASHITQSVTQPKTLKLPKITQKNTKFKGLDVTTDGPKWSRLGLGKMLFHPATDLKS